jgi:general secretion pathway protein F
MPAFEYIALDSAGRERRGVLEGDTARQVRQLLREQALLPVTVAEVTQTEARRSGARFTLRRGISALDLAMLTRQLATLARAGIPLEEALLAVSQQTESPRVQAIMSGVRARVLEGRSLADGLGAFPQAFPEIYRSTVAAGEQSGRLDNVLERLADYTENSQQLKSRIRNALVYPVLLSVVSLAIVSLLLGYVVPVVVNVFKTGKQQLPLLTRALIAISDGFRNWWWLLLLLGIGTYFGLKRLLADRAVKSRWHRTLLELPLVGRVVRGVDSARFARTLSILTASAVPVLEALRIAGEVVSNLPMRDAVAEAAAKVREGAPIARSLAASKLYPPMLIHLIASGETSGELEAMLERAASNQEREMDGIVNTAVNVLGPVMILVMGGFVLLIVLALLLPIFELNQLVR